MTLKFDSHYIDGDLKNNNLRHELYENTNFINPENLQKSTKNGYSNTEVAIDCPDEFTHEKSVKNSPESDNRQKWSKRKISSCSA